MACFATTLQLEAMHRLLPALALAALLAACGGGDRPPQGDEAPPSGSETAREESAAATAPTVLFLGDSITAGYGLDPELAFPAHVERALQEAGFRVRVVNAGVSGDTSAGGLARLDWLLRQRPAVVFVELGANDGLRGLDPQMTESNLRQIVERARAAGSRVILAGMRLPPNYGRDYVRQFEALFPRLADELDVAYLPFLLEGVAGRRRLNLADGIHPNAAGHEIVAANVLPIVKEVVAELEAAAGLSEAAASRGS